MAVILCKLSEAEDGTKGNWTKVMRGRGRYGAGSLIISLDAQGRLWGTECCGRPNEIQKQEQPQILRLAGHAMRDRIRSGGHFVGGRADGVLSHPSDKSKGVARVGHPAGGAA